MWENKRIVPYLKYVHNQVVSGVIRWANTLFSAAQCRLPQEDSLRSAPSASCCTDCDLSFLARSASATSIFSVSSISLAGSVSCAVSSAISRQVLAHFSACDMYAPFEIYEHHIEMKLTRVLLKLRSRPAETLVYACPEPGCLVHYQNVRGYFILLPETTIERDMVPGVRCPKDGQLMYLAEVSPERKGFRLWKCPRCNSSRSNQEISRP